jgi:hypothetical protein
MDDLAAILRKADRPAPVRIEAPSGVLYNITHQTAQRRLIVHLTNYLPRPAGPVVVAVEGRYKQAALLTPDTPRDLPHTVRVAENHTKIVIPRVKTYTVVVLSEG